MDGATLYARRSARDPDWRSRQIAAANERRRRRFEADPDGVRAHRAETYRRWYANLREEDPERFAALREAKREQDRRRRASLTDEKRAAVRAADAERQRPRRRTARARTSSGRTAGLTFEDLLQRIGGAREWLRLVLADKVRRGRVELHDRRYSLNGGLDPETRRAPLDLDLADDRSMIHS